MVALPDNLKSLCDTFATLPEIASLRDGTVAKYKCARISDQFATYLREHGVDATRLGVCGYHGPTTSHVYPSDYDWAQFGHEVVIVGDLWIDWTARQMDTNSAFPLIVDARTELRNWNHIGV